MASDVPNVFGGNVQNAVGYSVGFELGAVDKYDGKKTIELWNVAGSNLRDHLIQGDQRTLISKVNWGLLDVTAHTILKLISAQWKKARIDE